jgi:hypothetical protein
MKTSQRQFAVAIAYPCKQYALRVADGMVIFVLTVGARAP